MRTKKRMYSMESLSANEDHLATTFQMFVDLKKRMASLENQLAILILILFFCHVDENNF